MPVFAALPEAVCNDHHDTLLTFVVPFQGPVLAHPYAPVVMVGRKQPFFGIASHSQPYPLE